MTGRDAPILGGSSEILLEKRASTSRNLSSVISSGMIAMALLPSLSLISLWSLLNPGGMTLILLWEKLMSIRRVNVQRLSGRNFWQRAESDGVRGVGGRTGGGSTTVLDT